MTYAGVVLTLQILLLGLALAIVYVLFVAPILAAKRKAKAREADYITLHVTRTDGPLHQVRVVSNPAAEMACADPDASGSAARTSPSR